MDSCQRAPRDDQASVRAACESRDRALDLASVAHIDRLQLNAERRRHGLDRAELADPRCYGGITYYNDSRPPPPHLPLQLPPFSPDSAFQIFKTRGISAPPRPAIDRATAPP